MRVVSKFAIVFFAAAILCLSAFTYVLAGREAARLDRALTAGLTSYGHGLRPILEATWRDDGFGAAERVVSGLDLDGVLRATLERADEASPLPSGASIVDEAGNPVIRFRRLIDGPGKDRAFLTLERPTTTGSAIIRGELVEQALAAGALATMMGILAVVLGAVFIGRPLERIATQARRIGEGDLSQRLLATSTDEIGTLKRELNAMCDRLVQAQARFEDEATARIETLETLRHLDRLRTVGTIASGMAHELGTPLNILLRRGQSLAKGHLSGPEEVRDAGLAVVSQVEKMNRIVRHLLDFVRSRKGPALDASKVDLDVVARHSVSLLASMGKKHGVTLVVEADEPVQIQGDFGQIEQALTNLIVNGIQAMPDGGSLCVRVGRSVGEQGAAIVEVSDTGEGMSAEVCARIFDPFFTTKPAPDGTGLGLHVTRGIVEDHHGSIAVESARGVGTTFILRLPGSR